MKPTADGNFIECDPRYLVFEFTYAIMLRKSQVTLVNKLVDALRNGRSMCHQMIMGAGKTTVVTPLLALMLADGNSLVTQVVPHALLEFSRGVMREKFAAVVRKPIFTFSFSRGTKITRDLYMKLCKARDSKAVICATPTSVKSFMLKFVEMMKILEEKKFGTARRSTNNGIFGAFSLSAIARRFRDQVEIVAADVEPQEVYYCTEILRLFQNGVMLLDEVDLLLHPLKSELNWPIGHKDPIDYSRGKLGIGMRWDVFWHLLDAIFYCSLGKMSVDFKDSREAITLLENIKTILTHGVADKQLQATPHLVLLSRHFYHSQLKPLLARWQLLYLRSKRLPTVEDRHLISYMVNGPLKDKEAASAVHVALDDEYMKLLNLSHDLLRNFVPHVLSKINRVGYGLLSKTDLKETLEDDPNVSLTRRLAAIPFVGKDIPSRASQFSHPDIVIGLTIMAYRYEGLRFSDFESAILTLREQMDSEFGPYHKRPASLKYKAWVEEAGGKVRGPREIENAGNEDDLKSFVVPAGRIGARGSDDMWPLHLLDLKDDQHMSVTYNLLKTIPAVMQYYLHSFVFPLTMEHHHDKISASGQDLGGDMLFGKRVGFSGTPSDLLPEELGQCEYDEGVDGQIIDYLTSEAIVTSRLLDTNWSVENLLRSIATASPPFHALLDCGALVTGFSNLDVARFLINNGLPDSFDGVVFLDHKDRKMILMRHGMNVVRLNQSGISPDRRFSFYDQIHTTGMDIPQAIDARAALTLGKDMTFRDYAQGAFRMRGIGIGQTIELFIIPEVLRLVNDQYQRAGGGIVVPQAPASPQNPLMPVAPNPSSALSYPPKQLLINVAAWLTVNGMKSENMQFRMLCHQSIDNVTRKRVFSLLTTNYRELTQVAYSSRAKEFAQLAATRSAGKATKEIEGDLDLDENSNKLFADDIDAILAVVQSGTSGSFTSKAPVVGIETIQKCLDILTERLDYVVPNSIPVPTPLSEQLRNSVLRRQNFIKNDYDKAVIDKILMVLVNSEGLAQKHFGQPSAAEAADEDADAGLNKEQTSEQEVLKEQEEEEEEEVVNEAPKKKKYSRDDEGPKAWKVESLGSTGDKQEADVESFHRYFYPINEFSVKNYMFSKGLTLELPNYLSVSRNYYDKKWTLKTHRRLKNVLVTMDFFPSKAALKEVAAVGKAFTKEQEDTLRRAFLGANDGSSTGSITVNELKEVLRAVDVDVDGEDGDKFFQQLPDLQSRAITFEDLKHYLTQRMFYRVQAGRYYVALSLFEAECLRAAMHQQTAMPFLAGKDTAVAIRANKTLLDATYGYEAAQSFQDSTAQACFRFLDSHVNYQPRELTLLLRALQTNDLERRYNFFVEVRSNRRRKEIDPATTALSKVFITADEHHLLNYKIAAGRITALLKSRGMYPRDAFAAIDRDRDGLLSGEDLRRGMEWLGLKLDPALLGGFMQEVDKDNDGFINLDEFKTAVGFEDDGTLGTTSFAPAPLPPMPSDEGEKRQVEIPLPVLGTMKVKIKKITKFTAVWNSQGSMSRSKISIWEPTMPATGGMLKQNKVSVCLGQFSGRNYDNPNRDSIERLGLELTDTSASGWAGSGSSSWLAHVVEQYTPYPARFRLAWSLTHGNNHFYAWEPVPPSEDFVALGFWGTTTDEAPSVKCMRCVPKDWCKESELVEKLWDDSGSSGRAGSIWQFNSLALVGFVSGTDPPRRRPYDLKSRRFFMKDFHTVKRNEASGTAPGVAPSSSG